MTNKEKYLAFCNQNSVPLFSQPFWMDAVCGEENWDVLLVEEHDLIYGSMAYYLNRCNGQVEIKKAPLTQNNGVLFYYPENMKYERKLSFEMKVLDKIIDKIDSLNLKRYRQYFHYKFTNWLPFYWRGYKQTTRYTYIIEKELSIEKVIENFNPKARNAIKKAEKIVVVKEKLSKELFYNLNKMTFERQGLEIPYTFSVFSKIYEELEDRNRLLVLYAEDSQGNVHSSAFFARDDNSLYYLMSGTNDNFRGSQSLTLLIFEGIKYAIKNKLNFDFEGSMKQNIEQFNRQFGPKQYQYFDISKEF